jgi:hypothetical protein
MDSRSDSLSARLKKLGIFEEYFAWWLQARPSFAERLEWLEERQCPASAGAVHRLHRSPEAAAWRAAEASAARAAMEANLPADLDATIRKALLDQRFSAVMGDLSHKELMDHLMVEQGAESLRLKQAQLEIKSGALALAERRVALLEENAARAKAALEGVKSKGGLSAETLRQIEEAAGLL